MKKLVLPGAILIAIFIAALFTAVQAGGDLVAPPSILAGLDDCQLPCWQDIQPHATDLTHAKILLASSGYQPRADHPEFQFISFDSSDSSIGCTLNLSYTGDEVNAITFSECQGLRVGDFIASLDDPEGVLAPGNALTFRGGAVIISTGGTECFERFSPLTPVQAVYLRSDGDLAATQYPWHGFIAREEYVALEPDMPDCF